VERAVSAERLVDASRFLWPFLTTAARLVRHTSGAGSADARRTIALVRRRLRAVAEDVQVVGAVQRAHRLLFDAYLTTAKDGGSRAVWEGTWAAWQEVGDPFWRSRTLIGLSEATLADRADRGQVVGWLEQAADLADGLRASTVRAEVELLCRRAGIALPAAQGASGDDPDTTLRSRLGLTSRELEVLRHLADGATNQDVASALFISPKTVSVHVSRILAKLGLTNRTEAAALAHRLGLSS
jgi:DNA-binding CsgD family transcriptional regulator